VRVRAAVFFVCVAVLVIGCGGEGDGDGKAPAAPGTLRALWDAPGDNVSLVPGTTDYEPGRVRVSFLVIDDQSRAVFSAKGARVWLGRGLDDKPLLEGRATLEHVGVPGKSEPAFGGAEQVYVTTFQIDEPGTYFLVAEPVDAKPRIQGIANVVVEEDAKALGVGDEAYPSRNPTLDDAPARRISTGNPPATELLRFSVAETLAAKKPFVVVFATPKFCESRTCGPVVDVVDAVRARLDAGDAVRFIHVEIYEDNDPKLGTNRWVREWKLPTEPWVFLVGVDGRIKERFEGAVSADELETAVRQHLL
jgi:hypothetical protein